MRILIIEDDVDLSATLAEQLKPTFIVDTAFTGAQGLSMAIHNAYDLITIDIGLPDVGGVDLCKKLRHEKVGCPILMLTGLSETETKVEALDSGADDFLVKPFHLVELLARIRALIRRSSTHNRQATVKVKDLEMDINKRLVRRNGEIIHLRRKEYDILELLLRHKGHAVDRNTILEHISGYHKTIYGNTVDVHIKHLRDKIDRPYSQKLIITAHGIGYGIIVEESG